MCEGCNRTADEIGEAKSLSRISERWGEDGEARSMATLLEQGSEKLLELLLAI